jgi:hypothetical protein
MSEAAMTQDRALVILEKKTQALSDTSYLEMWVICDHGG